MAKYILKRILWVIPVIFFVIVFVFTIMYFAPGDPAISALGGNASQEMIDAFNAQHGLDKGYFARLFSYFEGLLHLDFGSSYFTNVPVVTQIASRLPFTLLLGVLGLVIGVILGIPSGIIAATHQNSVLDSATMAVSMFFISMPSFWFALIMVMLFSIKLGWLPSVGYESWKNYVIPAITVGLGFSATIARQTRSSMLEVIRADYVTTARAKGQSESKVISQHCLKNGLIPVVTVTGSALAHLASGALVLEQIFSIPGLGMYLFAGISGRDMPVILGCVVVIATYFCIVMLIVDILYVLIDPRLKASFIKAKSKKQRGGVK